MPIGAKFRQNSKNKSWFLGNLSIKNCELNAKFENCIFKDNSSAFMSTTPKILGKSSDFLELVGKYSHVAELLGKYSHFLESHTILLAIREIFSN